MWYHDTQTTFVDCSYSSKADGKIAKNPYATLTRRKFMGWLRSALINNNIGKIKINFPLMYRYKIIVV